MKWKTLNGDPIEDLASFVREASKEGQTVHIGTDSLQCGRQTQFVSVVVIHTPMKGGRVAYSREVVPRINSLRERLWKEVWRSVTLALDLHPKVKSEMEVHIDASPAIHESSKYVGELVGLVMGQGFKAIIKPEAWAASHCADHLVRHHNVRPVEHDA